MDVNEKIFALADNFSASAKILTAISDETRQHLIVENDENGSLHGCSGGGDHREDKPLQPSGFPSPADHERCWDCESAERGNENFIILIPRWKPLNG